MLVHDPRFARTAVLTTVLMSSAAQAAPLISPFTSDGTQTLVPGGDFEGALQWTGSGFTQSNTTAYAGTSSLALQSTVSCNGPCVGGPFTTSVPVTAGVPYVLSAFVQASLNGSNGKVRLDLFGKPYECVPATTGLIPGCVGAPWQFISCVFTPTATESVSVRVVADGYFSIGSTAYVDNVSLTPLSTFVPPVADAASCTPPYDDGDALVGSADLCPGVNSADNTDTDGDGFGDICTHPSANMGAGVTNEGQYIGAKATLGDGSGAGAGAIIGRRANIQDNTYVGAGATVARAVEVGPESYIGPNTTLGYGTTLGRYVHIASNTTIGNLVSLGNATLIGDGVRIGRGTTVTSDFNAEVLIADGAKIGAGVSIFGAQAPIVTIASNARVRKGSTIFAGAGVGAGAVVGRNVTVCPGVTVGDGAVVRANNTLTTSVPVGGFVARASQTGTCG